MYNSVIPAWGHEQEGICYDVINWAGHSGYSILLQVVIAAKVGIMRAQAS